MATVFSARTARMQSSAIRELLKVTQQPDVISLAGGLPAPELFPLDALRSASERVFERHGTAALQYGPSEGMAALREWIAASRPHPVSPEQVLVTTGSQQGIHLTAQILLDPGDVVVLESPSYLGAIQAFDAYQAQYLVVESDGYGLIPEALEAALRQAPQRPKLIYLIPNHQNPSGVMLAEARRAEIVAIAERYDVMILEDDPYGQLSFDGNTPPPLQAYSSSHVIYLGSYSKVLAPGLRVGFAIAPPAPFQYLVKAKQAADLHTGSFDQVLLLETLQALDLDAHLKTLRSTYQTRCQALLASLERHFPQGSTWTRPNGGLFVWAELAGGVSTDTLLARSLPQGVAFVPGAAFCLDGRGKNAMRLNFSNVPPERLEEGIQRLGALLVPAAI